MTTASSTRAFKYGLLFFILISIFSNGIYLKAEEEQKSKPKKKWTEYFNWGSRKKEAPVSVSKENKSKPKSGDDLNPEGMVEMIDAPTANVVNYGGYRLNFRLYSQGGVVSHLSFGVFQRLNIGASWDLEKTIGTEKLTTNVPTLYVKFRLYDGGQVLPAFSIGYDGQGRFFDNAADQYRERERGLYGVFSREIFFPKLETHGGVNIAKFKEGIVLGFMALTYTIEQKVVIMTEFDNIRSAPENRFNAGIRIFPIPSLGIDFAVRHLANKDDRERIVKINYVGSF